MIHAIVFFAASLMLAGYASASASASTLNITIGTTNITVSEFLDVPAGDYLTQCTDTCSSVNTTVLGCGDTNAQCLCTSAIADGLVACEQCMFNFLVSKNEKAPDARVGSNPGLSSFSTACNNSVQQTFATAVLAVAPGWNGPIDYTFSTGATVVIVGFGAILAFSSLFLFASL